MAWLRVFFGCKREALPWVFTGGIPCKKDGSNGSNGVFERLEGSFGLTCWGCSLRFKVGNRIQTLWGVKLWLPVEG